MTADQALSPLLAPPEAGLSVVAQSIVTASEVEVGTHSSPQRYMYAHAMRGEVIQHVRTQASPADRDRLPAIIADWDALRARVNALTAREAGFADTITIRELPGTAKSFATATLTDPLVSKSFGGLNHTIAMAEIDKIVFPQRMINDEYATRLANAYPSSPGLEDLLQICVAPRTAMEPIQHLEVAPNTHVFTSPNTDLRFLGAFVKESVSEEDIPLVEAGGLPAAGVAGFVGYGSPVINAFRVGPRLILNNGHHRVYALQKLGVTTIPILIMNVSNPVAELPPAIAGIPRELLMSPRPPIAKDILDDALNINLSVKRRIKQLMIMMSANQYDIPV
jgi:hypothetical protein